MRARPPLPPGWETIGRVWGVPEPASCGPERCPGAPSAYVPPGWELAGGEARVVGRNASENPWPPGWEILNAAAGAEQAASARTASGRLSDWQLDGTVAGNRAVVHRLGEVDLYVPAGPVTRDGVGCNTEQEGNCRLYRVRWDLDAERAVEVEAVAAFGRSRPPTLAKDLTPQNMAQFSLLDECSGGRGQVQPAVSPDGTRLVWLERCWGGADGVFDPKHTRMQHTDLQTGATTMLVEGEAAKDRPQHPTWYDDELVLYHTSETESAATGDSMSTVRMVEASNPTVRLALAGPRACAAAVVEDWTRSGVPKVACGDEWQHSFGDVMVSFNAADEHPGTARMVSFGGALGEKRPYVSDIRGGDLQALTLDAVDETFEQCHHPAWHPDGGHVLCMRHWELEEPWGENGGSARLLYVFENEGGDWGPPRRLFKPPSPDALDALLGRGLRRAAELKDTLYTYKFAEWTPDGRHVICTLYTSDMSEAGGLVLDSRVVLIRPYGELRLWDITAEVERAVEGVLSAPPRRWQGVFGTAARVGGA